MHLTTLTAWALPGDILLVYLLWKATESTSQDTRFWAFASLGLWMWTTKWIKLLGHYVRYPADVMLMPLSILFGYFHGLLKLYAMFTLDVVSSFLFFSFPSLSPHSLERSVVFVASNRRRHSTSKLRPQTTDGGSWNHAILLVAVLTVPAPPLSHLLSVARSLARAAWGN